MKSKRWEEPAKWIARKRSSRQRGLELPKCWSRGTYLCVGCNIRWIARARYARGKLELEEAEEVSRIRSLRPCRSLGFVLRVNCYQSGGRRGVVSVRWQNKRFQHSSPHRDTDLTTICRWKCLCESSGVQSRGFITLVDRKIQDYIGKCRKSSFILLISPLP